MLMRETISAYEKKKNAHKRWKLRMKKQYYTDEMLLLSLPCGWDFDVNYNKAERGCITLNGTKENVAA